MKNRRFGSRKKCLTALFLLVFSANALAQSGSDRRWQFGGGIGAAFGSGFTNVALSPGAIYNFNQYFAAGAGLQGAYVRSKSQYESYIYGGSVMGFYQPIPQVQLSVELEQLRVNTTFATTYPPLPLSRRKDNFWNTALYLGAGYRVQNVTIGARYNILFDPDKSVYSDAFMPFIRAYF